MNKVSIGINFLSLQDIEKVIYQNCHVQIDNHALNAMKASRKYVDAIVSKKNPVYGINTGFGALSSVFIEEDKLEELQYNLIRSHCTGVGEHFNKHTTRAIMLIRAHCLAKGYSGVSPYAVELLCDFINNNIYPQIPRKGSVGASGDLAPLSHLALSLIGEGEVIYQDKLMNSSLALQLIKKEPLKLKAKDGLALINGTAVMSAIGSVAYLEANRISKYFDIACAFTLEGIRGSLKAYHPSITDLKPHPGQKDVVYNLNKLLSPVSEIANSHLNCNKVQDPYSLRCVPQVHGACRQTLVHLKSVLDIENNSVTDNPLVFVEKQEVLSGGNFHGEAIAMAMDYAALGVAEYCNISERRVEKMMNPTFSELPAFLTPDSGLNSGLMIAQVTAAALVSENKILCHPASIDSVPTSTDKEDHVSMGVTAGRKLLKVIENAKSCLSIELLCAAQAITFQRPLKSTPSIELVYSHIREVSPPIIKDRVFATDINSIHQLINSNKILQSLEKLTGDLK